MNTHGIVQDERGQDQPEYKKRAQQKSQTKADTAKPELTDYEKTPGSGTLLGSGKKMTTQWQANWFGPIEWIFPKLRFMTYLHNRM